MGVCDSVTEVLISLWKLKFLAYLLNLTQRFVMCVSCFGKGRSLPNLLRRRVHGTAEGRKTKTFQVSKESTAVCS